MKSSTRLAILLVTVTLLAGCSVKMSRDNSSLSASGPEVVTTKRSAEGIDGKVGWGRITPFYIPIIPVYVEGDANQLVMEQVRKALTASGNTIAIQAEGGVTSDGPVLQTKVDRFWFNNYTYFFPIVPTWGSVQLTISVTNSDGATLWQKAFEGSGFTFNFFNGYTSAAEQSWESIHQEMVAAFTDPQFKHLFGSRAAPASLTGIAKPE